MKPFRNRDGLTLVELLVTIAIGSIVTLAATTVLLLGLRINRQSTDTVTHQNTTRIILSTLEDMASEAQIKKLITGPDSWYICSTANTAAIGDGEAGRDIELEDTVLIGFDVKENRICTGGTVKTKGKLIKKTDKSGAETVLLENPVYTYENGTAMLEGVYASHATLDNNNLLTFAVQTEEGNYTTSVYCRMAPKLSEKDTLVGGIEEDTSGTVDSIMDTYEDDEDQTNVVNTTKARAEFLKLATSQRGSPGLILERIGSGDNVKYLSAGRYYTQWYIGSGWQQNGWNKDTPWCACFISWVAYELELDAGETEETITTTKTYLNSVPKQSNVDNFIAWLGTSWHKSTVSADKKSSSNSYTPIPGDLIFFDWEQDNDADHVGAVLAVNNGYIYTIEGNSADMVAVRRYTKDDPRIMGYGVLDWKANSELGAN